MSVRIHELSLQAQLRNDVLRGGVYHRLQKSFYQLLDQRQEFLVEQSQSDFDLHVRDCTNQRW
jgi:hypothetical protein